MGSSGSKLIILCTSPIYSLAPNSHIRVMGASGSKLIISWTALIYETDPHRMIIYFLTDLPAIIVADVPLFTILKGSGYCRR